MFYEFSGFRSSWSPIIDSPTSQKLRTITPEGIEFVVDLHFTPQRVLTANIVVSNDEKEETRSNLPDILGELCQIAMMRYDFDEIHYTMAFTKKLYYEKFEVDEFLRDYCRIVRNTPELQNNDDGVGI